MKDYESSDANSESGFARSKFQTLALEGLFAHGIATEFGGNGNGFQELANEHQKAGFECRDPGIILSINAHLWGAVFPLLKFGSESQKQAWLPDLLSGSLIAGHAITEPDAGSAVQAMSSYYKESDSKFVLNGRKRFITNTPLAGLMVIYAKSESGKSISAFLVSAKDQGVEFLDSPTVQGCQSATMGDIVLDNCALPADRLLGKPGAGVTMIQLALELERAFIFAGISGVMQWQLQEVVRYVRNRQLGDKSLSEYQAVSHKLADMKLRLDTTCLWINQCAFLLDAGKRITLASAETKLYASEAFLQSCLDSVHVMGAHGLRGNMVPLVQDAMAGRLMSGSSEIQKNIIAALLGLKAQG